MIEPTRPPLRVLMITSEWPSPAKPYQVPFIVRQVDYLRKAGVDVQVFPFRGAQNPINYARAWRAAQVEIRRGSYHLIHAQWGQSGILALPRRLPLVVTFRGDDLEGLKNDSGAITWKGRVLRSVSQMVARLADEVILVSDHLARFIGQRSYTIIPSGLDLECFRPVPQAEARAQLGLSQERKYVLFAGSAGNPRKRYALAKQVVEHLRQEMDVELLTASGVNHDQIPLYMNASNVLLLLSWHEGSPNVVKEALACNLPVISTDVGDVRKRIGGIPGCILLNNIEVGAVADAVRSALQRAEPIHGREHVLELDENIITRKVIEVYQRAIQHGRQHHVVQGEWR
jgi:glycosyltransferase involved in cell wall biosynthesis